MPWLFRSKLLPPSTAACLPRPRLLAGERPRLLAVQAPAGAGKSLFLSQWMEASSLPAVYYQLDELDRDPTVFTAHLGAGLQECWPDWSMPAVPEDPVQLAAELVNQAIARPPLLLILDRIDAVFGQAYLADFLRLVLRYAPPPCQIALGSRAPIPIAIDRTNRAERLIGAVDLAFTPGEAAEWLGDGDWQECFARTGGFPLALRLWREQGQSWPEILVAHALANLPPHTSPESGRALVTEWVSGRLSLGAFAHHLSEGKPGVEQRLADIQSLRSGLLNGEARETIRRLDSLWDEARGGGDHRLMGAVALLRGEAHYALGEYGQAMEWYQQAFAADPTLELTGAHSAVAILRDQGQLQEAASLAQRCIAARQQSGELQASAYAHHLYGVVLVELGRFDEAENEYLQAEQEGLTLSGDPFIGILALSHRALLQMRRDNQVEGRRLAEQAYGLARGRSPWLTAICAMILGPSLMHWGEAERGQRLIQESLDFLKRMDAKWQLHTLYTKMAAIALQCGAAEQAHRHLDQALALAAREGYVQYLLSLGPSCVPLLTDAILRRVEVPFCQELLIRMGPAALPALRGFAAHAEPALRHAALYPYVAIGGEEALTAVRTLLYDPDESVRDAALMAWRSLGQPTAAVGARVRSASRETDGASAGAATAPEAPPLSVLLVGPLQIDLAGRPVTGWRTAKAKDLLAYLALQGNRPVPRDQLIEALWPETDLEGGQGLLHTTLYYLRRTLRQAGKDLISFTGGAYRLESERVHLDYARFLRLANAQDEASWRQAVLLHRGDLLEGIDYAWCEGPRTEVRLLYLDLLRRLAGRCRMASHPEDALQWLQRLVQSDPLAEDGHLQLMECYSQTGNRNAAIQQYQTLLHLLRDELGLEPSEEAQTLYRRLLG